MTSQESLRERIERFLFTEARLMDENRYEDWLDLFADPCTYWVPSNSEDTDPSRQVSIIYADRAVLESHVRRLNEGKAFAQTPPSRMRRLVSNIEIDDPTTEASVQVQANFMVVEIRRHTQRVHAGQSVYELIEQGASFKIAHKKVNLVAINEHHDNLTFLL